MKGLRRAVLAGKRSRVPGEDRPMEAGIFLSRHHGEDRLSVRVHWNDSSGAGHRKWFPAGRISDSSGSRLRVAYAAARRFRGQYMLFREAGKLELFNPALAPYTDGVLGVLLGR